jgi:hypothetical protein
MSLTSRQAAENRKRYELAKERASAALLPEVRAIDHEMPSPNREHRAFVTAWAHFILEALHDFTRKRSKPNPHVDTVNQTGLAYLATVDAPEVAEFDPVEEDKPGIVYVVGYGQWVKIGFTGGELRRRLAALQTGAPEPLTLFGQIAATIATERVLHEKFGQYRAQGEWFRNEGEVAAWIKAGCPL